MLKQTYKIKDRVGLIVNVNAAWLGSSPDGFIEKEDGSFVLIEVKTPVKGKTMFGNNLLDNIKYLRKNVRGQYFLKENHPYYSQIQLGLLLCNLPMAKLIIYVSCKKTVLEIDVPFDINRATCLFEYFSHFLHFLTNVNKMSVS